MSGSLYISLWDISLFYFLFFIFFLSQQFITRGAMAVRAYRRNYVWSINTLTFFFMQLPNTKDY